jgi:choline kinase
MKAIILAAGRGHRMRTITADQPKCFVELCGKKLIEWQMDALNHASITNIAIVRGYLANAFQYKVSYFDNPRWSETNMLMSLVTAKEWLRSDTCIISYSDIVYSEKTVDRLINGYGDILITYDPSWLKLWSLRFDEPLSDAETFKLNKESDLIEIGGRANSVQEIEGQFMGLLRFTPKGWGIIEKYLNTLNQETLDKMDMTKLLKGLIISGEKVGAIPINEPWYEVDNENDLTQYLKPGIFKL